MTCMQCGVETESAELCSTCYWRERAEGYAKTLRAFKKRFVEAIRLRRASKVWVIRGRDFWGEYPGRPVSDWQYEVSNGDTRLGYWEWVANKELADG